MTKPMTDMTTWSYVLSHIRSHWAGFLVVVYDILHGPVTRWGTHLTDIGSLHDAMLSALCTPQGACGCAQSTTSSTLYTIKRRVKHMASGV